MNNICVIVPLRSSQAKILLEQTIGRGLRLMWRDDEYTDLKRENRHTFARLRYVKDDGLLAFYSPDFLVRTAGAVYLVAALVWCKHINALSAEQRGGAPWHYVLLGEEVVLDWQAKGARLAESLNYARLRPLAEAALQSQLVFK